MRLKTLLEQQQLTRMDINSNGFLRQQFNNVLDSSLKVNFVELKSFKGLPEIIKKTFECKGNLISSLDYAPIEVGGDVNLESNINLISLEGIGRKSFKEIDGSFYITGSHLKSNILGLLLTKKLKNIIDNGWVLNNGKDAIRIIRNHLKDYRDINDCQEALIEAGFKEYAKL